MPCRHCGKTNAIDRRGLCRGCYRTPIIRAGYGVLTGQTAYFDETRYDFPLGLPTEAEPGTEEKIRVMEMRAEMNLRVTHPLDNHYCTRKNNAVRYTEAEDLY